MRAKRSCAVRLGLCCVQLHSAAFESSAESNRSSLRTKMPKFAVTVMQIIFMQCISCLLAFRKFLFHAKRYLVPHRHIAAADSCLSIILSLSLSLAARAPRCSRFFAVAYITNYLIYNELVRLRKSRFVPLPVPKKMGAARP